MVFKHSMTSAKKRYSHHLIMISIAMNMNGMIKLVLKRLITRTMDPD